jgi:peptide/nickel transport system substrate-binding protein
MKRTHAVWLSLALLLLSTPELQAQSRNETLLVVLESGANSMDIHGVGANRPAYQASWNIYDRLMTYGVKTLPDGSRMYDYSVLKPELAESWQVGADGMSVTFKLRKDAKFHDGTAVTARDVKWSFDRAVTVGGFPTFQMKAGSLEKSEQFTVVDDQTFRSASTATSATTPTSSTSSTAARWRCPPECGRAGCPSASR